MKDLNDEESRASRRLTRATTKTVERATKLMSEGSKSTPTDIAKELEEQKKIGDKSPTHFNVLLDSLSKAENRKIAEKGLGGYLSAKLGIILEKLFDPAKNVTLPDVEIRNLASLIRMSESLHHNFVEALKSIKNDGNGVVFSRLIQNGVFNVVRDRELLENLSKNEKLGDSAKPVQMFLRVNDFILSEKGNVGDIEKLAEDPHARAVLVHELKSNRYVNELGQLEKILQSGALKESELFELLVYYTKNSDTYGEIIIEAVTNKLRDNAPSNSSQVNTKIENIENAARLSEAASFGETVLKDLTIPIQGFGLKGFGEKGGESGRWAAITNNVFESNPNLKKIKARDFVILIGDKLGLWKRKDDEISKVNLARALNPFVLLDFGLLLAELGIQRGTQAIPNKVLRGIVQAPLAAILRAPRIVLNFLGQITSTIPAEVDVTRDKKATANEPSDAETISREDTESINSGLSALSSADDEALSRGASADTESEASFKDEEKSRMAENIREPNTSKIASARPEEREEAKKIAAASEEKFTMKEFPYAKARTEYAIRDIMSHRVFKENVTTDYDNKIIQLILNQKTDDPRFNRRVVEAMALRNALAERERLSEKTPADEVAIELLRVKLNNAISSMETLQKGRDMTDTARNDSRAEASMESAPTLNLEGVGAKHGNIGEPSARSDSDAEDSPRTERDALLSEDVEAPGLFGRFREALAAVGRLFGGGKAEAKAGAAAAESGDAKYEYNQVKLNGAANGFKSLESDFENWSKAQGGYTRTKGEKEGDMKYEFAGGRTIEVSGKDVVMKGFAPEVYQSFRDKMGEMFINKPTVNVSSSSGKSISTIAKFLGAKNAPTFMSRLTSIGLFFQQLGSTIKSFFTGPPTPAPQTTKAKPAETKAEESTKMSLETSEVVRTPKPVPTPAPKLSEEVDQKRQSLPPRTESVEPKKDRRQITSAPAKGIPSWASRVSVTIASNRDLQATQSTVTDYANTHGFRDVQVEQKSHSLSMQLEDKNGGRLSVSAEEGKHTVNIEEVRRSNDTPNHIAQIATELPNKGPKEVTVSGRDSMKDKVETALKTVGEHKITTPADKENLSHHANQATTPHK